MNDVDAMLAELRAAVSPPGQLPERGASALRLRLRLQPAGGPGTKVMPPTYSGSSNTPVYVEEDRIIDGERVHCVSLDSVASQANRLEETLLGQISAGLLEVPTIWVDQGRFGIRSALEFSHRCFDAWVEDAMFGDTVFGQTDLWAVLGASRRSSLTALMEHSPSAILFGCWASRIKNPQGAARLPRVLLSEITAIDAEVGARASSKLDTHHVSSGVPVYAGRTERIAIDAADARQERGKAQPFPGEKPGRASSAGYGNVVPQLASHGGITMREGLQVATVSLPALRECGFPENEKRDPERDIAGRLMLAALAVRLLALQVDRGYDLRSGCLLVPDEEPQIELLDRLGQPTSRWPIAGLASGDLLAAAIAGGREHGLAWSGEGLSLEASAAQLQLLELSLAEPVSEAD